MNLFSITASLLFLFSTHFGPQAFAMQSPSIVRDLPKAPVVSPGKTANFRASWEKYPENVKWTNYLFDFFKEPLFDTLDKASDMKRFCPAYSNLDREHKAYVWIELISQMAYYESAWNPVSRMKESGSNFTEPDPVTGDDVYSEGLLQLSYQDTVSYRRLLKYPDCKIDWSKDKNLSAKDPAKTILDPYINLECGVRILADQVRRKGKIVLSSGVYWAVLREVGGSYSQVTNITKGMKKISFCQP